MLIGNSLTVKAESSRDWWVDDALLAALPLAALGMAFANEDGEGGRHFCLKTCKCFLKRMVKNLQRTRNVTNSGFVLIKKLEE